LLLLTLRFLLAQLGLAENAPNAIFTFSPTPTRPFKPPATPLVENGSPNPIPTLEEGPPTGPEG
jgi:hypothetical protein